MNQRAQRNRTISLTPGEEQVYLNRCLMANEVLEREGPSLEDIMDRMICGDFFRLAPRLPQGFVDLLIVDPPYNLNKTFGGSPFRKMAAADYQAFTRQWIESLSHTLKATASVYVCCDWQTSMIAGPVLGDFFILQNRITWQREKGRGALRNWKNAMEDIWFATLSKEYTFHVDAVKQRRRVIAPYRVDGRPKDWQETPDGNYRDTYPSNFWEDISVPYWSMPENTDHPAQKPEKLMAKLILASSDEGGVILDPFAGVGSSAVAAKKLGRHYIGIEQEAQYCALAAKRLEMADKDSSIQGYTDRVFWERNSQPTQKGRKKARAVYPGPRMP
jgi:site-specific DNA-methyltransferase (adenine-specific)